MINLNKVSKEVPNRISKQDAENEIVKLKEKLFELQNLLYAEKKHSLLIVLQGMDGAGKDSTIRHVFSSVDPQGCSVKSFKTPTEDEMAHDFLWRVHAHTPPRGMIEIFNRSHYEDIIFPTVHKTIDAKILKGRFDIINNFEDSLTECGTVILKFFLHISKEEQTIRMEERLSDPRKKWKYNANDLKEAKLWDDYMNVYEEIIDRCSPSIPWQVVPADHKWYRNYVIAEKIVDTLGSLKMKYPQ